MKNICSLLLFLGVFSNSYTQVIYMVINDTLFSGDTFRYEFEKEGDPNDNYYFDPDGFSLAGGVNAGPNLNFVGAYTTYISYDSTVTGAIDVVKTFNYGDTINDSGFLNNDRVYFDKEPHITSQYVTDNYQYVGFFDNYRNRKCFGWMQIKRMPGISRQQNKYIIKDLAFDTTGAYITAGHSENPLFTCDYLEVQFQQNQGVCYNNQGTLSANAINGNPPYNYSWLGGNYTLKSDSIIQYSSTGFYEVLVTDVNGCTDTSKIFALAPDYGDTISLNPLMSLGEFRPGFTDTSYINVLNPSCNSQFGTLNIVMPPKVTYINNAMGSGRFDNDTLKISFSFLDFDSISNLYPIVFETNWSASMGEIICFDSWVNYTDYSNGSQVKSDLKTFCTTVINGYDPNDIAVVPGNCDAGYVKLKQPLTYKIRFQNEGNADAINIHILDTIDNSLDPNTLRVLGTSHPDQIVTSINSEKIVKFDFKNIHLIDKYTNEELSKGYVEFQISPKQQIQSNTTANNRSGIYFDFNPVVLTNTVKSTFVESIPQCEITVSHAELITYNVVVFPNPNDGTFTVSLDENWLQGKVKLIGCSGDILMEQNFNYVGPLRFSCKLSPGVYILELSNAEMKHRKRLVVVE